jgi:hypothetical protein
MLKCFVSAYTTTFFLPRKDRINKRFSFKIDTAVANFKHTSFRTSHDSSLYSSFNLDCFFFYNQLSKCYQVGMSHWLFDSNWVGNVKCQLYVSH